jgi:competence protein ComEA
MRLTKNSNVVNIIYAFVFLLFAVIYYFFIYKNDKQTTIKGVGNDEQPVYEENIKITSEESHGKVYITGEINSPGVYDITKEERLIDIVQKAGGFTKFADIDAINLAKKLVDEEAIKVPSVMNDNGEYDQSDHTNEDELIDINEADESELVKLNGIGPAIANNIIRYREENGDLKSLEELKNVPRIGDKIFEGLKHQIKI